MNPPHMRVSKVWGEEEWIINTERYCGKLLRLTKGMQCSLHRHHLKDETFYVLSGQVELRLEDSLFCMHPDDSMRIMPGKWHRFGGLVDGCVLIEFSTHHDDDDVERQEPSGPMSAVRGVLP